MGSLVGRTNRQKVPKKLNDRAEAFQVCEQKWAGSGWLTAPKAAEGYPYFTVDIESQRDSHKTEHYR